MLLIKEKLFWSINNKLIKMIRIILIKFINKKNNKIQINDYVF